MLSTAPLLTPDAVAMRPTYQRTNFKRLSHTHNNVNEFPPLCNLTNFLSPPPLAYSNSSCLLFG